MRIKNCFLLILFTAASLLYGQRLSIEGFPPVQELPLITDLPDPLVMCDGSPITSKAQWLEYRKPELRKLFQHYMYGYLPTRPEIEPCIIAENDNMFGGLATYKEVELNLILSDSSTHKMYLALFIPNKRIGPAPVFIAVNKCGSHTLVDCEEVEIIPRSWTQNNCGGKKSNRGFRSEMWNVENLIRRGYALATYSGFDLSPDDPQFSEKVQLKYRKSDTDPDSEWGTLAVWAWGLMRIVDYLESESAVDTNRICATGWSRRGKAALLATAFDDRIDLVIPHQSGTGGMALSRMHPNESVARINEQFPHWFNKNFAKFNDNVDRLPFDQHLLIALVAPRPLMDTAGLKDTWASSHLALEAMKSATPVYELLGERGIVGDGIVFENFSGVELGRLLQYQLDTEHTLNVDYWNAMIDFADLQFESNNSKHE